MSFFCCTFVAFFLRSDQQILRKLGKNQGGGKEVRISVFQIFLYGSEIYDLVRERGLEPLSLAVPDPKSGAYTNFATLAVISGFMARCRRQGSQAGNQLPAQGTASSVDCNKSHRRRRQDVLVGMVCSFRPAPRRQGMASHHCFRVFSPPYLSQYQDCRRMAYLLSCENRRH